MKEPSKLVQASSTETIAGGPVAKIASGKFNFLVAESNAALSQLLLIELAQKGYRGQKVANPDELTQVMLANHYHAIFIGQRFGGDSEAALEQHPQLTSLIRRIKSLSSKTRIVVVGFNHNAGPGGDLLTAGIDDYLNVAQLNAGAKIIGLDACLNYLNQDLSRLPTGEQVAKNVSELTDSNLKRLSLWLDKLPGQLLLVDQQYHILALNRNCEQLLRASRDKMVGRSLDSLFAQDDYSRLLAQIEYAQDKAMQSDASNSAELVLYPSKGEGIPVSCQVKRMRIPALTGFIVSFSDISQSLQRRAEEILALQWQQMINHFSQQFISLPVVEFEPTIEKLLVNAAELLRASRVSLYRLDRSQQTADLAFEWQLPGLAQLKSYSATIPLNRANEEISQLLANQPQSLLPLKRLIPLPLVPAAGLSEHFALVGSESSFLAALHQNAVVYAWIGFDLQQSDRLWLPVEKERILQLKGLLEQAFQRKKREEVRKQTHIKLLENHGKLSQQASVDSLTGLANRRSFDRALANEMGRAIREKSELSVIFCDVDYFKQYNDRYGHVAGDNCLQQIADNFRQSYQRGADFIARYGGEEFVVILPGVDCRSAYEATDKMRRNLLALEIPHEASPLGRISLSAGLTCLRSLKSVSVESLLTGADRALYHAKSRGKNCVYVYRPVQPGE